MSTLLLLIVAVLFGLYWLNSNHARVNAIEAARRHCAQLGFQFLDGSVALDKTRPERVNGQMGFSRLYRFEYADQQMQRWVGYVIIRLPDRTRFQMDPASMGDQTDNNQRARYADTKPRAEMRDIVHSPVKNALPTFEDKHHGSDSIKKP
ncbi:MAG: hypothetical protein DSZ33_07020 [Gammaproteobacteria bacterium]|nr:MAG: hypothetical protein DSZ33_07020 [Gammaproteobacteria bacterium]